MKKTAAPLLLLAALLLAGCGRLPGETAKAPGGAETPPPAARVYAIVVKDAANPYMRVMYEGFESACAELGASARFTGPGADGAQAQEDVVYALIEEGVDAIAIAANDSETVSEALRAAMRQGIPVVSLDSGVRAGDRRVHIQQASPETLGRVLIQASARILEGQGEFAILTTTDTMPNQASWVRWMLNELAEHPDSYSGMELVEIAYGRDEAAASASEVRRLIAEYPDLRMIIAPTTVGMLAAAETIAAADSGVLLTGLGLPSEMEEYILSGLCPWMYLWNPSEVGYLAACAAHALVEGEMHGQVGEILSAGKLGDKVITESEDGGTEIVLGNPKMFDMSNVSIWSELF